MPSSEITLDYLANHPQFADELARISWTEWRSIYEQRGETFDDALGKYRERLNINRLPLALVALSADISARHRNEHPSRVRSPDAKLIGTVSLKFCDLPIRPELDPWLGGVYVVPEWRGRGVASLLCRRAVDEAARLKIPSLFLWTHSAEALYLKLGWHAIERTDYCSKRIVLMELETVTTGE